MKTHSVSNSLINEGLALLAVCAVGVGRALAEHPNIVLLSGDDHGWEETGYNGHPHLKTPALDAMAASGLRMDHFYSAHPSCSPTRGSVMTGCHPNRYGTFYPGCSLRPEEITIASLLQESGYATGHFGTWHLGPVKADSPTNPGAMGFDEWLSHDNVFELNPQLSRNGGPRAILGNGYKLVVDGEKDTGIELFDLEKDPGETKNLSGSRAAVAKELQSRLRAWQESVLNSLQGKNYR